MHSWRCWSSEATTLFGLILLCLFWVWGETRPCQFHWAFQPLPSGIRAGRFTSPLQNAQRCYQSCPLKLAGSAYNTWVAINLTARQEQKLVFNRQIIRLLVTSALLLIKHMKALLFSIILGFMHTPSACSGGMACTLQLLWITTKMFFR